MATFRQSLSFRDARGSVRRVSYWVVAADAPTAQTNAATTDALFAPLTNAALYRKTGPDTSSPGAIAYGAAATYEDASDKAEFVFSDASGRPLKLEIPAPKSTIFLADQETVDRTNADVAAFVGNLIGGTVGNRYGGTLVTFLGGRRIRRKMSRKVTLYMLDPTLTIPEE